MYFVPEEFQIIKSQVKMLDFFFFFAIMKLEGYKYLSIKEREGYRMILVGYQNFKSKEGKDCFVLKLIYPFRNGSGVGNDVYTQFVDQEVYKMVTPSMIGKQVEFDEVREGRWSRIVGVSSLEGGNDDNTGKQRK